MAKILLILALVLGMIVSFAAIGLVVLFATGAVKDMDEVRTLLAGELPRGEGALAEAGRIVRERDAIRLLRQQRGELQQDLVTLRETKENLERLKEALLEEINSLQKQISTGDEERDRLRQERFEKTIAWLNRMSTAEAAAIMDELSDEMVLRLLPGLEDEQAAGILSAMANDQRKADIIAQLVKGKEGR